MKSWKSLLALVASCAIAASAFAQSYPTRSIKMIVPFAAGGSTDIIARFTAAQLTKDLGQAVVVENIGGAAGALGTMQGMNAAPDGYTLIIATVSTMIVYPAAHPKPQYTLDNFVPITNIASMPNIITVTPSFPAKDLKEFVAHVKANETKLNNAHAGVGSVSFTTCLLLNSIMKVKPTTIPFNGTGPSMNALVGGQVDYMCDQIVNAVPQINGGTIKVYAIATAARNPSLPDVPTTKEAGLPEFEASAWNALFAPKGTPKPIVDKLSDALSKALDDEGVRKRLLDLGSDIPDGPRRGGAALGALVKSEVDKWGKVIKEAGAEVN